MPMRVTRRRRGPDINSRWCSKCGARNNSYAKFYKVCATPLDIKETIDDSP